jgi:hypothetical protein
VGDGSNFGEEGDGLSVGGVALGSIAVASALGGVVHYVGQRFKARGRRSFQALDGSGGAIPMGNMATSV